MTEAKHLAMDELENGLEHIRQSPSDGGVLAMIVRRPEAGKREVLDEGVLDTSRRPGGRQLAHAAKTRPAG